MKRFRVLWGIVVFLAVSSAWGLVPREVEGAVPKLINFQCTIQGQPGAKKHSGSFSITFKIYDAPTGGNMLWLETQSVTTSGGSFNVLLGSINPIPDSAFNGPNRYLGITVASDPEMSPRFQLVSVGYAYRVNSVDGALGGNITTKVSIGPGHTNTGTNAFVAGNSNIASGDNSAVSGGLNNVASRFFATVSGGFLNKSVGAVSTVGGGQVNIASGDFSSVSGGDSNFATGNGSTISGGRQNRSTSISSTVGGGYGNFASGNISTVAGGNGNNASEFGAAVVGGSTNKAAGGYSFVGGGIFNLASGGQATIGGGQTDTASAPFATVPGGCGNHAAGSFSTVGGGFNNRASNFYSTVAGGDQDTATGNWSAIPGGQFNKATGSYSFAAGRRAKALHHGSFVWADSTDADFNSTAPNQFLIRASGGVGIGTANPQGALDVSSTTGAFIVPRMTGAQRVSLTPVNGMIIYNTTTDQFNFYEAGAWVTKP